MQKTLFLVSTLALLNCSNRNFNTPQSLNVPRVLAIQAEPPQPKVGEATTLQALVYLPPDDPGENATYTWSWCPLPTSSNNGYKCPIDEAAFGQIYASLGLGTPPSFALGTGRTATFVNPFPAALLTKLCGDPFSVLPGADAGARASQPDGGSQISTDCLVVGYPITVYLSIDATSTGKLDAVFFVNLPTDDSVPGNQNPVVGGVQASWKDAPDGGGTPDDGGAQSDDGGEAALDAGQAVDSGQSPIDAAGIVVDPPKGSDGVVLDEAFSTTLPRQVRVLLHLQLPPASSETLTAAQAAVEPNHRVSERLDVAWFAEAGDFGDDGEGGHRTGFMGFPADVDSPFSGATDNKWTLPKSEDYKGDTTRLKVIVRDNRGGVNWTEATARIETT